MLALRFAKSAARGLARMPQGIARRMLGELKTIAADPAAYRGDWKPLQGSPFWRLRVGDWRVIFRVDYTAKRIAIAPVLHRREVYR